MRGLLALVACLATAATAADYGGPLFDAHLHYNEEASHQPTWLAKKARARSRASFAASAL